MVCCIDGVLCCARNKILLLSRSVCMSVGLSVLAFSQIFFRFCDVARVCVCGDGVCVDGVCGDGVCRCVCVWRWCVLMVCVSIGVCVDGVCVDGVCVAVCVSIGVCAYRCVTTGVCRWYGCVDGDCRLSSRRCRRSHSQRRRSCRRRCLCLCQLFLVGDFLVSGFGRSVRPSKVFRGVAHKRIYTKRLYIFVYV